MNWLRNTLHRATRHIGWRGDVLLTFAFIDVVYGWTMITATPSVLDSNKTFAWIDSFASLVLFGLLWWAAAVACIVGAFRHDDWIGFNAAIGIKVLWGLLCLAGWMLGEVSIASVAIWLGFARLVWRISGWTEHDQHGDDVA